MKMISKMDSTFLNFSNKQTVSAAEVTFTGSHKENKSFNLLFSVYSSLRMSFSFLVVIIVVKTETPFQSLLILIPIIADRWSCTVLISGELQKIKVIHISQHLALLVLLK